ncbi:MAG TPA: response regulator [Stellaceae bacterium]
MARIVVNVDDQDASRYIKSRDLRSNGFEVVEARSGAEGLRAVEQHRPMVVLLDVQLPDINGFEVCRYIKDKWPEIMVLMTSATFITPSDRTAGLDSGADSYLVQPAEPLELAAALNALVRIRRSEDALRELNESLERRIEDRLADLAMANEALKAEIEQRKRAETALVQAQKMEAVGQLTGGIAHDFNNLLTAVIGNVDLIRGRTGDARVLRWAEGAFKAAQRGSKLTSQLLAFARLGRLDTAPVDVNALIVGMRELLNQTLGVNIAVETVLSPQLPPAMADVTQLELALLNLAINSRDAMPDGGTLTIATAPARDASGGVTIAVTDSGVGMRADVAARAFDPFFTTKAAGKGTGLGLSQVYGIARQFGGDVALKSEIGQGTTITLTLPRAVDHAVVNLAGDATATSGRSGETLLVVDDDSDVREIICSFLIELGYDVTEAPHGEAALAALAEMTPDLLIVDFAMPGMNGAELAVAARQKNENQRILFLSGFVDTAVLDAAVGAAPLLRKPFRPGELATAVRAALEDRRIPARHAETRQ